MFGARTIRAAATLAMPLTLLLAGAGCSDPTRTSPTDALPPGSPTSTADGARAASATPGDEFCRLETVARRANLAVDATETDAVTVRAQVAAALDASKAAAAVAPEDYIDIATRTVDQQEGVVALLEQYDYSFAALLASEEGNAFISDPAFATLKTEREGYLDAHCDMAVTAGSTPGNTDGSTAGSTAGGGISLTPGDEGIRQLFQLLRLGGQVPITDDQIECAVSSLSGVISDADLQAIGAGAPITDAGTQAFVLAVSTCGITLPQG